MKKLLIVLIIIELYFLYLSYIRKEKIITSQNFNDSNIYKSNIDDYLIGVVSCEMPASYSVEALKAQAVAARTFLLNELNNNNNILYIDTKQCYLSLNELKNKWKDDYDKYYNIVLKAVLDTKDEYMTINNKLFKSFYFSTSNGYTESSMDVFNEGNIKSVESSWDKNSKEYKYEKIYSYDELKKSLGDFNSIEIIKRNNTNHVLEIKIDNKIYTGIEFRKILSLRSTDFIIEKIDNNYKITTYGYGHGVGMSQTGAEYLAKSGYDYKYILNYYYSDIEIKNSI